jgi:hypothetical protein
MASTALLSLQVQGFRGLGFRVLGFRVAAVGVQVWRHGIASTAHVTAEQYIINI